jgi:hypothetical protein
MTNWSSPQMRNWRIGQFLGALRRMQLALRTKDFAELGPPEHHQEFIALIREGDRIATELERMLRALPKKGK